MASPIANTDYGGLSQRVRPEAGAAHRARAMGTPGRPDDMLRESPRGKLDEQDDETWARRSALSDVTTATAIGIVYRRAASGICRRSVNLKAAAVPAAGEQSENNRLWFGTFRVRGRLWGDAARHPHRQFVALVVLVATIAARDFFS